MSIILDVTRNLLNAKQKENESLQDYTKRFRVAQEVLESHIGGPIILTKIVEAMPGYDEKDKDKRDKYRAKANAQFMAYLYLDNADQSKYGSILMGLNTQQSLGNDQYPRSITEANNVLSNHKFDKSPSKSNRPSKNDSKKNDNEKGEDEVTLSFAQMEGKCYCCGKAGHKSPSCRFKDKPKEEWVINKIKDAEQTHVQAAQQPETANITSQGSTTTSSMTDSRSQTGWAGAHIQLQQMYGREIMKDWILLDNQSSTTIFCNEKMVNNIHQANESMTVTTNAGDMQSDMKADLPGWGPVWFNQQSMTNIFSYKEMADKYHVTYDNKIEDAFTVHLLDRKVKFERIGMNLYATKCSESTNDSNC